MSREARIQDLQLIHRKLSEAKAHLQQGQLKRSIMAFTNALRQTIELEIRKTDKERLSAKIFTLAKELTGSDLFKSTYGPVSFADGQEKVMYDFMNSLIEAEQEETGEKVVERIARAQKLLDAGQIDQARELFDGVLLAVPEDAAIHLDIGERYMKKELYEDAERVFRVAEFLDTEPVHLCNRLGIALRKMNRYHEAIEQYKKALSFARDDENIHTNIALVYYLIQDLPTSYQHIKRALELAPDLEEAKKIRDVLIKAAKKAKEQKSQAS
ncbi:MAG: tetratricopeptide repeat protein [Deltaproteobacteria bacterium]|nr:tetratricopeptide repeat protein [Deltaproteobacteria bacterium]